MSDLVPFGKYKGQPIEALLADRPYCEWVALQAWLPDRYPAIFQIIVTRDPALEDTPDHNRLQASFLKLSAREYIGRRLFGPDFISAVSDVQFERDGWDAVFRIKHAHNYTECEIQAQNRYCTNCFYYKPCEHRTSRKGETQTCVFLELKPNLGDDYPQVLRTLIARDADYGLKAIFAENFNSVVALDDVREIFLSQSIRLIVWGDE